MKELLLKNAKIVLKDRVIEGDILTADGIIRDIINKKSPVKAETLEVENSIDLDGKYVVPGFIDVHIHGSNGADAMDGTVEALKTISSYIATKGTTKFLATTLTSSKEELINVLKIAADLQDKEIDGATIFGVHMEGPYFDIEYKGAQNEKYMKPATEKEIKDYLDVKPGLVKMMSLSPHTEQSIETVKFLKENGVIVSVGHSAAKFNDVMKAVDAGLSHSTHTFNGMRGINHREPGVAGAVLISDKINAEVIFDKIHIHPEIVRLMIKAKGTDKVVCITDAMAATGLPNGDYKLGELDVYVKDGEARLKSNDSLAGSVLTMDKAFKHVIELGYPIYEAVKLTSTNAAIEFGLNAGAIEVGKEADFTVLDDSYNVDMTIVNGNIKYQR
ncbi:N-acetylglucosamine-6-phosphate deacetylase [Fusobacterium sp. SB021]|uniref:N-acetylglucosamine-6-phosphate deacetylase n=1 Tax=Fusobacterium sp. SB021 TaxID=2744227 RepID=UPI003CE8A1E5